MSEEQQNTMYFLIRKKKRKCWKYKRFHSQLAVNALTVELVDYQVTQGQGPNRHWIKTHELEVSINSDPTCSLADCC